MHDSTHGSDLVPVGDNEEIQMMPSAEPHDHSSDDDDGDGAVSDHENDNENENDNFMVSVHKTNIPRVTCALLASITTGGVSYAFGLYGNALKKNLHLSQAQLETISSATFCAGLFSWVPGMFVDRFGTRAGITVGGITGALSLMMYWTVAKQHLYISNLSVVVATLSALGVAIFLSCALITGAVFKIISCSCGAGTKGSAVGVAKGFVGLGSGAYACLFQSIRQPSTSDLDFLPMCAFFFICAASIPSFMALPSKADEKKKVPDALTPLHFRFLFGSLLVLALLIVTSSLRELFHDKKAGGGQKVGSNYPLAGLILFVWLAPIAAQIYLPQRSPVTSTINTPAEERDSLLRNQEGGHNETAESQGQSSTTKLGSENPDSDGVDTLDALREQPQDSPSDDMDLETSPPRRSSSIVGGEKNLYQMLQTYPAWLMLWTATILVGGGIVETNNLGQMVESLHFAPVVTSASLSLFSVAQSGGRVATGAMSDWALSWNTNRCFVDRRIPRPFFLVVASVVGVVAHTILAISTEEFSFVVGIALSGWAFGSVWPLMVLIVGEIYGTAHVGANYMFYDVSLILTGREEQPLCFDFSFEC